MNALLAQGVSIENVTIPIIFFVTSTVGILGIAWGAFKALSGVRDQISDLGKSVMKELSDMRVEIVREHPTKHDHDRVETRVGKLENRVTALEHGPRPSSPSSG